MFNQNTINLKTTNGKFNKQHNIFKKMIKKDEI